MMIKRLFAKLFRTTAQAQLPEAPLILRNFNPTKKVMCFSTYAEQKVPKLIALNLSRFESPEVEYGFGLNNERVDVAIELRESKDGLISVYSSIHAQDQDLADYVSKSLQDHTKVGIKEVAAVTNSRGLSALIKQMPHNASCVVFIPHTIEMASACKGIMSAVKLYGRKYRLI